MKSKTILSSEQFSITLRRLCFELIENHNTFEETAIIGIQPRGVFLAQRIVKILESQERIKKILSGNLDITFHRDDFRQRENAPVPAATQMDFIIENKKVVLVDDVLYTGRTIRAALDALLAFGRPSKVELVTLINRKFSRHLPIEPDYIGKSIDTIATDKVRVQWKESDGEDAVILLSE